MPRGPDVNMHDWRVLSSAVLCIFVVSRVLKFVASLKMVRGIPGPRVPFCPIRPPGVVFPTISWWNPGLDWVWKWRLSFYNQWRSEIVSFVPFLLGPPVVYTSSLEATRQVVAGGPQSVWVKSPYGPRHRGYIEISSPQKGAVTLDPVQAYTTRVAFLVISACGFGLRFQWEGETEKGDGNMGIRKAMRIWAESTALRIAIPSWMYKLPFKRLRNMVTSSRVLRDHMTRMILEHRADLNSESSNVERRDLFSLLVRASEEDSEFKLSESEVVSDNVEQLELGSVLNARCEMGNVFAMMLAGHETTAATLAATIGFLGIYQNVQEDVYQEIIKVVGHDRGPTFEDFPQLEEVAHTVYEYEALRLYRPSFFLGQVPLMLSGCQRPSPHMHWAQVRGGGSCLFLLTFLVRDWIIEPIMNPGETGEQWRERMMQAEIMITLKVKPLPVRLKRRARAASPAPY
ncbi:cytochrome P450 [Russula dissimulans]|nr:cytochrome P450 [Russula dissimulans]